MSLGHSSDGYTSATSLSSSLINSEYIGSYGAVSCQPKSKPGRQMVKPDFHWTAAVARCCSDTQSVICHIISFVTINCFAKRQMKSPEAAAELMAY
jgi:hypothetical protein